MFSKTVCPRDLRADCFLWFWKPPTSLRHRDKMRPFLPGQSKPSREFLPSRCDSVWRGAGVSTDSRPWLQPVVALRLVGLYGAANSDGRSACYQVYESQIFLPLPIFLPNLWLHGAKLPSRGEFDAVSR